MLRTPLTASASFLLICFSALSSAEPGKNAPQAVANAYSMVILPDTKLYAWRHQKTDNGSMVSNLVTLSSFRRFKNTLSLSECNCST